ncbi:50S ribosomal protein L22 [Patescibacteria group bacterium]
MTVTVKSKYVRIAPRKVRLVINEIRGLKVDQADARLKFTTKRAAHFINKLLSSAVASAVNDKKLDKNNLFIKTITADEGPTLKRFKPRAYGRATEIRKRSTHLSITVAEIKKAKKKADTTKTTIKADKTSLVGKKVKK